MQWCIHPAVRSLVCDELITFSVKCQATEQQAARLMFDQMFSELEVIVSVYRWTGHKAVTAVCQTSYSLETKTLKPLSEILYHGQPLQVCPCWLMLLFLTKYLGFYVWCIRGNYIVPFLTNNGLDQSKM